MANNLREALESVAGLLASGRVPYLDEEFVCDLLRLHPAEPAPVVTDEAVEAAARSQYEEFSARVSWGDLPDTVKDKWRLDSRRALEAATPLLGPRPLLDREAVGEILVRWLYPVGSFPQVIDAVMELARPMPTREQIAEALIPVIAPDVRHVHQGATEATQNAIIDRRANQIADAVAALLNGAES